MSKGRPNELHKLADTHAKRAVSSKKSRGKRKNKNSTALKNTMQAAMQAREKDSKLQYRQVYQKLPTGGNVQSYTSQQSTIITPQSTK